MGGTLPPDTLPLRGIRVVECGAHLGVAYAGRLLADLGADVVKLELPAGDALRHRGPWIGGAADPERSAAALALHAGKRSVVVAGGVEDGELLAGLLAETDVVLRDLGRGGPLIAVGMLDDAEQVNPGLIVADLTPYGATGPLAGRDDPDLVVLARSGMLSITSTTGNASTDPGPSTPLRYVGEATWLYAALHGTVAVLGALHARRHHGSGQRLDVSALESLVAVLATSVPQYTYAGNVVTHSSPKIVRPWDIYTLVDGQVSVQCSEDSQWRALARILGHEDWVERAEWATTGGRVADAEALEANVAAAMAGQTLGAFLAAAHAAGVPATEVQTNAEVLAWPQLVERQFFTTMSVDEATLVVPGPPLRFDLAVPPRHSRAPRLGEHTADVLDGWRDDVRDLTVEVPGDVDCAPLAGRRIADMTWVWAGPYATMQLAYLGADVIKVESPNRVDLVRRLGPYAGGVAGINRSGYFNQYNQGKRSIALDLTRPADRQALDRLVAVSDLIVDNMRSGALARMGYDDARLRTLNRDIVATAMTGFGDSGPDKDRAAYGAIINSLSGVAAITGRPGGGPVDLQLSLADPCSGLHAAVGMIAALYRQRVTGRGGRVDCAMVEAWIAACPWGVLAESCGADPQAIGNRDPLLCPNGVFPCAGDDQWVAIAVDGPVQFAALAALVGLGERLGSFGGRREHEEELEDAVAAWTRPRPPQQVAAMLHAAGVPAARVERMDDVCASEHLAARGFFTELDHAEVGPLRLAGPAYRGSLSPFAPACPPPCLGEHTEVVFRDVLGLVPGS